PQTDARRRECNGPCAWDRGGRADGWECCGASGNRRAGGLIPTSGASGVVSPTPSASGENSAASHPAAWAGFEPQICSLNGFPSCACPPTNGETHVQAHHLVPDTCRNTLQGCAVFAASTET